MVFATSSIYQEVSAFTVLLLIPIVVVIVGEGSSIALRFNISGIEGVNEAVIELKPFAFLVLDVTDVVAHFGVSDVADHASQFILIVGVLFGEIRFY
jgi:hypothetical protein